MASLSTTTLVHEVYAGMAKREELGFADRGRFLAYAARAMRGFIIDAARTRMAFKRGALAPIGIQRLHAHQGALPLFFNVSRSSAYTFAPFRMGAR